MVCDTAYEEPKQRGGRSNNKFDRALYSDLVAW